MNMRQQALISIIEDHEVSNQEQLIQLLKEEFAIETTQTVISRDLKALGCVKKTQGDKRIYALPEKDVKKEILRMAVKDVQHNESMIVISTGAGLAPFVGDTIDELDLDILGSLAGENAVFVAPKSVKNIKALYQQIVEKCGGAQ